MPLKFPLQILIVAAIAVLGFAYYPQKTLAPEAKAQTGIPIGGFFLPGTFDIFSPIAIPNTSCVGLTVSVVGPNPGYFLFQPILGTYRFFPVTPSHINVNTIALGEPGSQCAIIPSLVMLGTSALPGPE